MATNSALVIDRERRAAGSVAAERPPAAPSSRAPWLTAAPVETAPRPELARLLAGQVARRVRGDLRAAVGGWPAVCRGESPCRPTALRGLGAARPCRRRCSRRSRCSVSGLCQNSGATSMTTWYWLQRVVDRRNVALAEGVVERVVDRRQG